jgi:excinuclease ABC subunit B
VTVTKSKEQIMEQTRVVNVNGKSNNYGVSEHDMPSQVADPIVAYLSVPELEKLLNKARQDMDNAAKDLNFSAAAKYRDEFFAIEQVIKEKKVNR